ncbi:MAG: S8 family serine peptidase [Phycisphaerales bacterium]
MSREAFGKSGLNVGRSASIALTLIALCGTAMAQQGVSKFGQAGTVKVRVPNQVDASVLSRANARTVGNYDSFSVVEVPAQAAADLVTDGNGIEQLPEENKILLNVGAIDTSAANVRQAQRARGTFAGKALHMIQFAGPVQPAWLDDLAQSGVQIVTYIPSNAYIVYGNSEQIAALQTKAMASANIQWNGEYLAEHKIDPAAAALIPVQNRTDEPAELFAIQMVQDPVANPATLGVIDASRIGAVVSEYELLNYHNVVVPIAASLLPVIAAQPDVISIQRYVMPEMNDERQDQIIAGNLTGNLPTAPGYLAWLGTKGFTQAQFNASNFAVDVSDSGIDNATTSPNHFGLYESGVRPGTSRIIYNRLVGTPHAGSTLKGCDGHGTLNTHIVLGFSNLAGAPFADTSGYRYGLGVCPFTKAGSSVIFDPSTFTSPNYASLQSQAYNNGARISTNSWGAAVSGVYNTDAQSYDALVRDAQPAGSTVPNAGNQEMVIVFSAGNSGSGATTIGSPGTGKNVITVGAGENVQAFGGADGCGTTDAQANSANDIIPFSSRGPCVDGRKKPEIVAPGTHVSGGVTQTAAPAATGTADACFTATGVCGGVGGASFFPAGQQFYTASSGTSHSCPAVAGGCALIRQFFINQGMAPASPAMTKAMLMNSARYMTGTGAAGNLWSNSQGMGSMHLGDLFDRGAPTPTLFRDEVAADIFTATGQTRTFTGTIANAAKPFRVTLAWTDAPGATSGSAFKNNLDLTVTIGATTYKGNVFGGAFSVAGGSADLADNAESVFLPAGTTGSFTVTVTAANINSDGVPNFGGALDQDFALVIYNRADPCVAAQVSSSPSDQHSCPGGVATFTASATGTGPLNYQWRRGVTNLTNAGHYSGVNLPTLTVSPVSSADAGADYNCVITNACGTDTTANASLFFCAADFNCDGQVDDSDFVIFSTSYDTFDCTDPSMASGCPADMNGDGFVDDSDFVLFSGAYDAFVCP